MFHLTDRFELVTDFMPAGDQPEAIAALVRGLNDGLRSQVLLGVTGSGKTFTIANVVAQVNRPTLVLAHNKILAAQLYGEFKELFPNNAVEYFVSYYDYYQPEAYVPSTDTYIEKDASINDEIDKMRHAATKAVLTRRDCLIVASVSCIYGIGSPETYRQLRVELAPGDRMSRERLIESLVAMQYTRNDVDFHRGVFRVRGDIVDVFPAYEGDRALRIEFFGDEIEAVTEIDPLRSTVLRKLRRAAIFPGTHYATTADTLQRAIAGIEHELAERLKELEAENQVLFAQRLEQRTRFDLEMLREIGYCTGIENYSRHLDGRMPGEPPFTLINYFPDDFLLVIDESHMSVPQLGAMYRGDRSRKDKLIEYGFRLPSARDNRPLTFEEFNERIRQVLYVSATPAEYELRESEGVIVEQVVRPTGLVDPEVAVRPAANQWTTCLTKSARAPPRASAPSSPPSPNAWPKTSRTTTATSACASDTCTPTSKPSSASNSCAICAGANSTCWSASTCCAKGWTSRRSRSSPSSTPTRKAISARKQASSRPAAAPPATSTARSSCTPKRSPAPCAAPWMK